MAASGRKGGEAELDPVASAILEALGALEPGRSLDPQDVARLIATARRRRSDPPELWRRYLPAVRQQAIHLARDGRIVLLRKGVAIDASGPVKGVVRLALPSA
ncbi:MAG: DUF3253 domain-containing protein [Kiloniellales bacterium]